MSEGKLIVIEGMDGTGKTTQAKLLCNRLYEDGIDHIHEFMPSGGPIGCMIREKYLRERNVDNLFMLHMMMADFYDRVDKVILPTLNSGIHVVCERWLLSTLAYQGGVGNVDFELIATMGKTLPRPWCTILLWTPIGERRARMASRKRLDSYEMDSEQHRVEKNYNNLTDLRSDCELGIDQKIYVVRSTGTEEEVARSVWDAITVFGGL